MEMIPAWIDGDLVPVEKLQVHRRGLRHKAVSVFVFCAERVLIQKRALAKYHSGGLWANTCCTHPQWEESAQACARRRLREELGLEGLDLVHQTVLEYRAEVGSGLIEHEVVDIYFARLARPVAPVPNPDEVMATAWIEMQDLRANVRTVPQIYVPWLRVYLERWDELSPGDGSLSRNRSSCRVGAVQ